MKKRYSYKTVNGKKDYVHRQIMEAKIGRSLESFEHVYHLNGDPKDNSEENLVIIVKNYNSGGKTPPLL